MVWCTAQMAHVSIWILIMEMYWKGHFFVIFMSQIVCVCLERLGNVTKHCETWPFQYVRLLRKCLGNVYLSSSGACMHAIGYRIWLDRVGVHLYSSACIYFPQLTNRTHCGIWPYLTTFMQLTCTGSFTCVYEILTYTCMYSTLHQYYI